MLGELKAHRLLQGLRGSAPADMDALVEVILKIADLSEALGPAAELEDLLSSLEPGCRSALGARAPTASGPVHSERGRYKRSV